MTSDHYLVSCAFYPFRFFVPSNFSKDVNGPYWRRLYEECDSSGSIGMVGKVMNMMQAELGQAVFKHFYHFWSSYHYCRTFRNDCQWWILHHHTWSFSFFGFSWEGHCIVCHECCTANQDWWWCAGRPVRGGCLTGVLQGELGALWVAWSLSQVKLASASKICASRTKEDVKPRVWCKAGGCDAKLEVWHWARKQEPRC